MAFLIERPVDRMTDGAGRVLFDLGRRLEGVADEAAQVVTGLRLGTLLADGTMGAPPAGLSVIHHDVADDDRHGPVARVWLRATAPGTYPLDVSAMTLLIFKALEEIGTGNFRMAESEVFTSNLIFDTFADWEHQLKHLEESRQRISGDKPDGPKP